MEKVISKNKCTGCTACATVCPKGAISMVRDNDGFLYPVIDNDKCINCGLCKKKCPVINTSSNEITKKCYVGYSNDDEILKNSSSGGIFTEIANYILDNDGVVVGAGFDKNNSLKHIAITKKSDLCKLQGSKYLQSDLDNIFSYIKDNITNKQILFVGTPCQVAGLKAVIKHDNLICIDVVCHGVPSPKLFKKYIAELEKSNNDKLLNYNFRDKSTGWDTYSNIAIFKNKKISQKASENNYMKLFLSDVALRESCYECNFKLDNKYSDITLGDFWGVKNYYPDMYNKNGVSAVIINSENGMTLFNKINKNLCFKECALNHIIVGNRALVSSSKRHTLRLQFFDKLENESISQLVNQCCKKSFLRRVYTKVKRVIKRILGKV